MTLFDDTTAHNSDSTTIVSEPEPATTEQHVATSDQHATVPAHADEKPSAAGEDFASALETFTTEAEEAVSEDRVIKGTVLKLTGTHVVVDIGAKSEGMLPLAEVLDHEGNPKFKPGDEIDVMRDKGEAEEGYINLSHQKAQRIHAWDEIEKAHNEKKPIKAVVIDRIKGGLTVDIMGARAFLPGSQVDLRPIRNLDGMKGQTIEVAIIKLNKKRGNIVVSRKELLVGAHVSGRVISVTDYGAFVELEQGIEGLVHVSEMTWSKRMKHPSKLVNVGDHVECVVLNVNPGERRISLGMRQLAANPWDSLHEKFPVGMTVEGRVRNLTDFGAFIEIEDGIDGLVHVSNLSWTKRVKHPSEVLKKGDRVKAIVLAIEPDKRRLSLGVKQLQPEGWESFFEQHHVGDVLHGKVLRVASFGAFVELADGVEGLCHNSEAVDANGQPVHLEPGQEHDFKIIKMNPEEKKVGLSIRAVGEEASRSEVEAYKHPVSSTGGSTIGELVSWKRAGSDNN